MKKTLLVALLLIGIIASVFANGDKESGASAAFQVPANGYDGSEVTITFYHTMGQNLTPVLEDYIKEFTRSR